GRSQWLRLGAGGGGALRREAGGRQADGGCRSDERAPVADEAGARVAEGALRLARGAGRRSGDGGGRMTSMDTGLAKTMDTIRVGVDIGGTLTDIAIMTGDGRMITKKVSSTVDNYARAIGEGLAETFAEHGFSGAEVSKLLHGTTVASNAILEQKGARTALIT